MLDGAGGEDAIQLFSTSTALFVENQGQWQDESVHYGFDGPGVNIAFTDEGLSFLLTQQEAIEAESGQDDLLLDDPLTFEEDYITHSTQFSVSFDGANTVTPVGLDMGESRFNYFIGDQSNWAENVPGYKTVAYEGLYDGIDLHTFGRRNSLKYEFYVAPGADYSQIQVSYDGIEGLWIDDEGHLRVETDLGQLVDDAPYIYQLIDGEEVEVAGHFSLVDTDTYTFEITGLYDSSEELVVDPNLDWATYLGGSNTDYGEGITTDNAGNMLIAGYTNSIDLSGVSNIYYGSTDAFVAKVSSDGVLQWATYLGGSSSDVGLDIAVDISGNAFLTGYSYSADFAGANNSPNGNFDAFAARISSGGVLQWATYLGGSSSEIARSIAIDAAGNGLVVGETQSLDLSSANNTHHGGVRDAFVAKITSGGEVQWATYLGGSGENEYGFSITTDAFGSSFVTGETDSTDFWGSNNTQNGGSRDAFVAKITSGGVLQWATYLGGSSNEAGRGIAIDATGSVMVTGQTASTDFSEANNSKHNGGDVFVAKVTGGGILSWSTYIGGNGGNESGRAIATDNSGNSLVTGFTDSTDFEEVNNSYHGGAYDSFVAKVTNGGTLLWATYLGGSDRDFAQDIVIDVSGTALVTGWAGSTDFNGANNTHFGDSYDAFVALIENAGGTALLPDIAVSQSDITLAPEASGQRITATIHNLGGVMAVNVPVRFQDITSGAIVGTQTIPSLLPYSSTDVSELWFPTGTSQIEVQIDPFDLIEEVSNTNNTARAIYGVGGSADAPVVTSVVAAWDENADPLTFGRYVRDVELFNTFTADVIDPNGAANIDYVQFTLGSLGTQTDTNSVGGWAASFDMGQLSGDETLTVVAYDDEGNPSNTWAGTVHAVDFPSWLGIADADDYFASGVYNLSGFFPPQLDLSHTIPAEWLIIGGMESTFRLGVDLSLTAGLGTGSNFPVGHEFVFETKVLDEELFGYSGDPFSFELGNGVNLSFNGLANSDDLSLTGLSATLGVTGLSLLGGPKTISGPPLTIPIGPVPTTVEAGVSVDLELDAQLSLGLNLQSQSIEVLPGTYFEAIVSASPYVYGGVGVSLASAGVEVAGDLGLHYRLLYDSTNGLDDQKWGTFGLTFSAVAKLGWWEARADWSPAAANWEFGDVPESSIGAQQIGTSSGPRPDILPWPNVAADGSGNVLLTRVVDLDADPGEIDPEIFYAIRDGSGTWSTLNPIATNGVIEGDPDGAFDGTGGAVVSWVANTIDPALVQGTAWETVLDTQEIYSAYWNGTTWSAPQVVTSDTKSDGGPEVDFHNGQGLMIWEHAGGATSTDLNGIEILYAIWDNVGKMWGSPIALTNDTEGDWAPTLAFDGSGNAMAVWVNDHDSDPLTADLRYATWNGTTWSALATVPVTSTSRVREPRLAFDSSGDALLGWIGNEGSGDVLYTSTWDSGTTTWSTPSAIDGTPDFMEGLDLSISGTDEAMLVWHGWDGEHDLYSTVRNLGTSEPWSPPARMTENADGEWMVSTTFDSLGEPVTVWANENVTTVFGDGAEGVELQLVPDLTISDLELISIGNVEGEPAQLLVDVTNTGWDASVASTVSFYVGDPNAGGTLIGTAEAVTSLLPGESETVVSDAYNLPAGMTDLYAVAAPDPNEVDTTDNEILVSVDALPPDTTGPQVSVAELSGGTDLPPNTSTLTLSFNEPVLSVLEGDISLVESTLGMVVPDHVYLSPDGLQARLVFEGGLSSQNGNATYTLKVLDRVIDVAGNPLNDGADSVFNFDLVQLAADFDGDGMVTGLDFLAWQRGFGTTAPDATKQDGDADNDLDVDGVDLAIWETDYGIGIWNVAAVAYEESVESGPTELTSPLSLEASLSTEQALEPLADDLSQFVPRSIDDAIVFDLSLKANTISRTAELLVREDDPAELFADFAVKGHLSWLLTDNVFPRPSHEGEIQSVLAEGTSHSDKEDLDELFADEELVSSLSRGL